MTGSNHLTRLQSCEKAMGWCTAQCEVLLFLFCENHRNRVTNPSEDEEKEEEEEERKAFWPFLVQYFHNAFFMLLGML